MLKISSKKILCINILILKCSVVICYPTKGGLAGIKKSTGSTRTVTSYIFSPPKTQQQKEGLLVSYSIVNMIVNAGWMVKFVMLMLLGFSIASWYIIFQKHLLFRKARQESELFVDSFWKCKTLAEADKNADQTTICPEASIFKSGYNELQKISRSRAAESHDAETFETRISSMANLKRTLSKAVNYEVHQLGKSLPLLATTGSSTPFIGLFGTVWGIMNSFQGIGATGVANLAVVAPGISEALIATAIGLAAAIPAVVAYNYFQSGLKVFVSEMENFSHDFTNIIKRNA